MSDRESILRDNPIVPFLERQGIVIRAGKTNRCPQREHRPLHYCVSIEPEKGVWCCHDCERGGSVIDWLVLAHDITPAEAMTRLGGSNGHSAPASRGSSAAPEPLKIAANGAVKPKIAATYDYTDENGKLLFQAVRLEPKDFRQRRPDPANPGKYIWDLNGVRRVLFNLPKVLAADLVFITEGEKDAGTVEMVGLAATTNVGGSKKWDESYTDALRGKEVVILPDNDKAGEEHLEVVKAALCKAVKTMRIVRMPEGIKDVSEYRAGFRRQEEFNEDFVRMCEAAECLYRGESIPIQTFDELEVEYKAFLKVAKTHRLELGQWLPSFHYSTRPVVPGELITFLLATGVGKTMVLQNIALATNLATILFELELPGTLSFERFVAMATRSSGKHVEDTYETGGSKDWREGGRLNHIVTCHRSGLTVDQVRTIIENASLKTSVRPVLVLIDYIQILKGSGSRYEKTSDIAEELKVLAKATNTIVVIASQVGRKEKKKEGNESEREVTLTDGKDSGSIENSSGLVVGGWRDPKIPDRLWLRILKNTKGKSGRTIPCEIRESLLIEEVIERTEPEPRNYQPD